MKKLFVMLAFIIASVSAMANDNTIDNKVLDAFKKDFATASQVEWTQGENLYRASFLYNNKYVSVYYDKEGQMIGLTRNISSIDLPVMLQKSLRSNYEKYWISDLFEVSNFDGTGYCVTLENGSNKIVLKSMNGEDWAQFQKTAKL